MTAHPSRTHDDKPRDDKTRDNLTPRSERSTTMQMDAPTTAVDDRADPDGVASDAAGGGRAASLTLEGLTKRFGDAAAVDGISLHVPAGSFLVLLGPSGCGKSTTLRMLAGLEDPSAGEIRFGERVIARGSGASVPASKRNAGLVFQSYALWPHKTVAQNVEWPLTVAKVPRTRRDERVAQVLELLGIEALASRYPGEISGGQQQRTAIARMIAPEPEMLLFDEPLSNLDAKLRVETRSELMRIHRATGATSVYVTHDQVEAMTMATHIALMRDGRIEQFGTPRELIEEPATAFAATFMGTPPANVIDGVVRDGRLLLAGVDVGQAPEGVSGTVRALYRSGSLTLAEPGEAGAVLEGTLVDQVPMAERWVVGIDVAEGTRVHVTADAPSGAVTGGPVGVRLPAAPEACFDEHGERFPNRHRDPSDVESGR
ncbi:MAG: ABC transporter ATP-binding protein [Brevibacterium yomogidense]